MSVDRWQKFVKFILRSPFLHIFNVTYIYENIDKDIAGPFLVIGTMSPTFDPFFLRLGLKESVRYVTSDLYFRNPLLAYFCEESRLYPEAKFVTDVSIVRNLLKCKNQDESIGIYPEGYRNWTG